MTQQVCKCVLQSLLTLIVMSFLVDIQSFLNRHPFFSGKHQYHLQRIPKL